MQNEFKAQLDAHEQKIEELKNELAASQAQVYTCSYGYIVCTVDPH